MNHPLSHKMFKSINHAGGHTRVCVYVYVYTYTYRYVYIKYLNKKLIGIRCRINFDVFPGLAQKCVDSLKMRAEFDALNSCMQVCIYIYTYVRRSSRDI